jgi:hypothetical protein
MQETSTKQNFKPLKIVIPVVIILLLITIWTNWYTQQVSIPRYCEDIAQTLHYLRKVVTEDRPAGDDARKPYLIAAKLLFLVPRQGDEPVDDYLDRVEHYLQGKCR